MCEARVLADAELADRVGEVLRQAEDIDSHSRNGFGRIKTERAGPDTGIEIRFSDAYGGELVFGFRQASPARRDHRLPPLRRGRGARHPAPLDHSVTRQSASSASVFGTVNGGVLVPRMR